MNLYQEKKLCAMGISGSCIVEFLICEHFVIIKLSHNYVGFLLGKD